MSEETKNIAAQTAQLNERIEEVLQHKLKVLMELHAKLDETIHGYLEIMFSVKQQYHRTVYREMLRTLTIARNTDVEMQQNIQTCKNLIAKMKSGSDVI